MGFPIRRATLCAGLILVTGLAGCSSSGGSGSPDTSGSAGGSGGAGQCAAIRSVPGVAAKGSAQRAVEKTYHLFFSTATSLRKSIAVLQHGDTFCPALLAVNNTSYGKQKTSATVSSVRLANPNLAVVTFTIRVAGQVVLPNSKGYAVREHGEWKVAAQTFCQLLTLEGTAPADCKDKSITALHG
jgi:hypothetical protein